MHFDPLLALEAASLTTIAIFLAMRPMPNETNNREKG